MASVICPECGRVAQTPRKHCKVCGTSLEGIAPIHESSGVPWVKIGIVGVLGFAVLVICNGLMGSNGGATRPSTSRPAAAPVSNTVTVNYALEGKGRVSITMENDTNGTEQFDKVLPYMTTLTMRHGEHAYISAQIISDTSAPHVTCSITADGTAIATASARGFPKIATCSALVP